MAMVKTWLEGSEAVTSWRGTRGPMVRQEQGLRQGCVLSPILFCAFANTFLLEAPTKEVPHRMQAVVKEFLSQGLQTLKGADVGINCPAMARRFMTTLFMDDTTLMAPTKAGLKTELEVYLNFCRKMRMRLNTDKSKLMKTSSWPLRYKAGSSQRRRPVRASLWHTSTLGSTSTKN